MLRPEFLIKKLLILFPLGALTDKAAKFVDNRTKIMILSACGLICDKCEFYAKDCNGCIAVKGQTFWAKEMMPDQTCPLFNCSVNSKGIKNCGKCIDLPCKMFRDMKDPNSTDEEHQLSLVQRVDRLKHNPDLAIN